MTDWSYREAASQSAAQHAEDDAAGNPLNVPECPYCGHDIPAGASIAMVLADLDPGNPEVGPQPDIQTTPAHMACHVARLERLRQQQIADIANGVEYASESPLPRPTPDELVEIVASAVLAEDERQVGCTLHELADWYSDQHPEDQPYYGSPLNVSTVHSHTRRLAADQQRPEWIALMRRVYDPHYDPFDAPSDPGLPVESREAEMLRAGIEIMRRLQLDRNVHRQLDLIAEWQRAAEQMVGDQS